MNPFKYGSIVKEPYFFDRKEEKDRIINIISGGNNIVLYSPRRYGKTSLIMNVIDDLKNKNFTCIYIDLMKIFSRESFIENYTRAILSQQSYAKTVIEKFVKFVRGIRPIIIFDEQGRVNFSLDYLGNKILDRTLEDIIDLPSKYASKNNRYIIVMDEFQDITKLNGENFEKLLRSKIQMHEYVNYIFMGSRTHILMDMFNNKNRPFYNSAYAMNLGKLPEAETIQFIIERFRSTKLIINEEVAALIIEKANNIPYYIQFLASEVWQYAIGNYKKIQKEFVEFCFERIIELKSDYYYELYDKLSLYQKKLIYALARENQNIFSAEYAKKYRLSVPSTTQKALKSLIEQGIIEKEENSYLFDDPFFREFILRFTA